MLTSATLSQSHPHEANRCPLNLQDELEVEHYLSSGHATIDEDIVPDCLDEEIQISSTPTPLKVDSCDSETLSEGHIRDNQVDSEPSSQPHPFTFRCRIRSSSPTLSLITPAQPLDPLLTCPTPTTSTASSSPSSTSPSTPTDESGSPASTSPSSLTPSTPIEPQSTEAGPSISALQDSLVACSIEPPTQELYSTLSKRRFGFDTTLSNVQYGYGKSKPYRFTSLFAPDPRDRKRTKIRKYKLRTSTSGTLLQKTLKRNHADSLRKRFPLRPISPPHTDADSIPYLDDDNDEDEFDDDEDDEIIDDFDPCDPADVGIDIDVDCDDLDVDGDAQVDDIVDMYKEQYSYVRASSPGLEGDLDIDLNLDLELGVDGGAGARTRTGELICLSSSLMTDPSGLDSVQLQGVGCKVKGVSRPVGIDVRSGVGGTYVFVADGSDF